MKTILAVDDEKNYLVVLKALLSEEGYEVLTTQDGQRAVEIIQEDAPDLVITDMKMPSMTGLELLKEAKRLKPDLPVVILTALGTVEAAVGAMKQGAYHYILKPFDNAELKLVVRRALELASLSDQKSLLDRELKRKIDVEGLIWRSRAMKAVMELVDKAAVTRATVLIHGESGTGKELIARALHTKSQRADKPFVAVNCGALTETLLESELFGHEKGAFTGAVSRRKGLFEMADGGTLFLDEVGSTSPGLQVRLLRVLQEQAFERVGGLNTVRVNVRVIAASNQNLKRLIGEGSFREDLYYRLKVFTIDIPALRERMEDVPMLAVHFADIYSKETGSPSFEISAEAMDCLSSYSWPGNVRELRNVIERAVVLSKGSEIGLLDMPLEIQKKVGPNAHGLGLSKDGVNMALPELLDDYERSLIVEALERSHGVSARAARFLGISPTRLQYKLGKYKLN